MAVSLRLWQNGEHGSIQDSEIFNLRQVAEGFGHFFFPPFLRAKKGLESVLRGLDRSALELLFSLVFLMVFGKEKPGKGEKPPRGKKQAYTHTPREFPSSLTPE